MFSFFAFAFQALIALLGILTLAVLLTVLTYNIRARITGQKPITFCTSRCLADGTSTKPFYWVGWETPSEESAPR